MIASGSSSDDAAIKLVVDWIKGAGYNGGSVSVTTIPMQSGKRASSSGYQINAAPSSGGISTAAIVIIVVVIIAVFLVIIVIAALGFAYMKKNEWEKY